jgi:hypothetical protein
MGELMAIHNDEVIALLDEDFVLLEEHKSKLQAARDKKRGLIDQYRDHVQAHGC